MQDFNSYTENNKRNFNSNPSEELDGGIVDMVTKMAKQFEGKSQNELIKAIFEEAKKRKKAGTLSNAEIEGFYNMLYPMLDDSQRRILSKIVADLKKI